MIPTELTFDGESVLLDSRKALLLSGSSSKSAADKSRIRECSFWKARRRVGIIPCSSTIFILAIGAIFKQ